MSLHCSCGHDLVSRPRDVMWPSTLEITKVISPCGAGHVSLLGLRSFLLSMLRAEMMPNVIAPATAQTKFSDCVPTATAAPMIAPSMLATKITARERLVGSWRISRPPRCNRVGRLSGQCRIQHVFSLGFRPSVIRAWRQGRPPIRRPMERNNPSWASVASNVHDIAATRLVHYLFQFSVRSRCTAMLAGLRTLIQTRHGPD
jgi:hypothetical protein